MNSSQIFQLVVKLDYSQQQWPESVQTYVKRFLTKQFHLV